MLVSRLAVLAASWGLQYLVVMQAKVTTSAPTPLMGSHPTGDAVRSLRREEGRVAPTPCDHGKARKGFLLINRKTEWKEA